MNKKYIVDLEGIVTVVTDTGETIERKDKYTETTDTILSLENLSESLGNKVHLFERRLNELNNKIRNESKIMRILNIALILLTFALLILSASISTKLFLSLIVISIPLEIIIGIVEKNIIKKDKEKRNYCSKHIAEVQHRIDKIQKRIEELSKNKTPKETNHTFTEIKPISEYYNIDASDYFVENYLIEERAKEMSKGKKKVKKKPKTKNNIEYEL